ncbi:T9SS C-terminal target domain-containing protein [Sediminicola sp. 1XM1-17]|uniref:T9SS C-terminal target domain-containing protein n=1 Tax=Sediminicola sp. 1XM1-17 TaxID=3127702 RepID=UPI0030783065
MKAVGFVYFFFLVVAISQAQDNVRELGMMPQAVFETSGLIYHNNKLITHNDSGNTAQLFELDTLTLEITRIINIDNAINVDWEDITQDDTYIYIGDIGNNNGSRQDLSIYRILKRDYDRSDIVMAEKIEYAYTDQTNFDSSPNSDWDAEALFVLGEELVVLTKQWQKNGTAAYSIPKIPGTYKALKIGDYPVNGLVTGASFNPDTEVLYLIGYSKFLLPFTVRADNLGSENLFSGSVVKKELNLGFLQVEGITYRDENHYYFSSERFTSNSPMITSESRLFSFDTSDNVIVEPAPVEDKHGLRIYKRFGSNELEYDINSEILGRAIFDGNGRRVKYILGKDIRENTVNLATLSSAIYYLTFYTDKGIVSAPFWMN